MYDGAHGRLGRRCNEGFSTFRTMPEECNLNIFWIQKLIRVATRSLFSEIDSQEHSVEAGTESSFNKMKRAKAEKQAKFSERRSRNAPEKPKWLSSSS